MTTVQFDPAFLSSLKKSPELRSLEDLHALFDTLREFEALFNLRESALRSLCKSVRYLQRDKDDILYFRGERASCWYILLSGYVFIDGSMFCPGASFGKRIGQRVNDCVILEPAEMIVIDFPDTSAVTGSMNAYDTRSKLLVTPSLPLDPAPPGVTGGAEQRRCMSQRRAYASVNLDRLLINRTGTEFVDVKLPSLAHNQQYQQQHQYTDDTQQTMVNNLNHASMCKVVDSRCSSDTSSAYSGSDAMQSLQSGMDVGEDVDLTGLVETTVDSDEEDDDTGSHVESLQIRDAVRECLETDPANRTDEDIEILLEFTRHLRAFSNMTLSVRRALCSVMVFAVVQKAGTTVMQHGEELDSWSVIVNGQVEITHDGTLLSELSLGDSFGITPTMEKLYHHGTMRTKSDDCQFVCITQTDYYGILSQGEENTRRHEEDGQVVMVTEHRITDSGSSRGHIVIKGTTDRLMQHLIEENSMVDPYYVEDFLLTRRIFIPDPTVLSQRLLQWFQEPDLRDRVFRIVIKWVSSHFVDFETNSSLMDFIQHFDVCLEQNKMFGQLGLLNSECANMSRVRVVTLPRSSRDEPLGFSVSGGSDVGGLSRERLHCGIFVTQVDVGSKAESIGLRRCDQLLEVNRNSFDRVSFQRAKEILLGSTHLSITVKNNVPAFKKMMELSEEVGSMRSVGSLGSMASSGDSGNLEPAGLSASYSGLASSLLLAPSHSHPHHNHHQHHHQYQHQQQQQGLTGANSMSTVSNDSRLSHEMESLNLRREGTGVPHNSKGFSTLGVRTLKIRKALMKAITPKMTLNSHHSDERLSGAASDGRIDGSLTSLTDSPLTALSRQHQPHQQQRGTLLSRSHQSLSNPDLSRLHTMSNTSAAAGGSMSSTGAADEWKADFPEHVLKIFRADQSFKYLPVHKETTAQEVGMLAVREFGLTSESNCHYSLCEVTVTSSGLVKQRMLPPQMSDLADHIQLASRYYLRNNQVSETLVPEDVANEMLRDTAVHILELTPRELAVQLTLVDYNIFRLIESSEYIDDLFKLQSVYGTPNLQQFAELANKEMFWVASAICSETSIVRRMKVLKQFIKLARHCKECRNFNSMFNITCGLNHGAVTRLKQTWEKLPSKHQKMFNDMMELIDPSRNQSRYRNLINMEHTPPPMIPFYPLANKDLTFIHLGNDTFIDGLVNFEKLRMISKEVRNLLSMCSGSYEPALLSSSNKSANTLSIISNASTSGVAAGTPVAGALLLATGGGSSGTLTSQKISTLKRRRKSNAQPNPKKMFEESQMVRRVKAYLSQLSIIQDEDRLMSMSVECEAPPAGFSSSTARRRQPSPTLSTTSTTSSTSANSESRRDRAKFGVASPASVRKMMALAENKTRPHQPPKSAHSLTMLHHPGAAGGLGASGGNQISTTSLPHHSPVTSPSANCRRSVAVSGIRFSERGPTESHSLDLNTESSSVTNMRKQHSKAGSAAPSSQTLSNSSFPVSPLRDGGATFSAAPSLMRHRIMYMPKPMSVFPVVCMTSPNAPSKSQSRHQQQQQQQSTRGLPAHHHHHQHNTAAHHSDDEDNQVSAV